MHDPWLIGSIGAAIFFAILLIYAQRYRAIRRLVITRFCLFSIVVSLILAIYFSRDVIGLKIGDSFAVLADAIGVMGLVLSAGFTVGGVVVDRIFQKIRIGVVIPSRVAFQMEVRKGLRQGLMGLPVELDDEFESRTDCIEDLSDFLSCFHRTLGRRPDYLVVASPGTHYLNIPEVEQSVSRFLRRGGRLFFIENAPQFLSDTPRQGAAVIRSDSEQGASVVARHLGKIWDRNSKIGLLAGPSDSVPAEMRYQTIIGIVGGAENFVVRADPSSWSARAAYEYSLEMLRGEEPPSILVCLNDTMALAAVRAVHESRLDMSVAVIGYDGIPRAIHAIAEPTNCFQATVRIPPAQYGSVIAAQIREDLTDRWWFSDSVASFTIPITDSNLVTKFNADEIISEY